MTTCPQCSAQLPDGAKFCTNCGYKLPEANTCKQCGATLAPNAAFCSNCGQSTTPSSTNNTPKPQKRGWKKRTKWIVALSAILTIVIAAICVYLFVFDGAKSIMPTAHKHQIQYLPVKLAGDDQNYCLIDAKGEILCRIPLVNQYGEVCNDKRSTPVIDGIFCEERRLVPGDRHSYTIYRVVGNKVEPISGLVDLESAHIINSELFPICKRGERIQLADKNGNIKCTVMPIDGKEANVVSSLSWNGLFIAETEDGKEGAINANGEWVIYPEWDDFQPFDIDCEVLIGIKDGAFYKVKPDGTATHLYVPEQGENPLCRNYSFYKNYITHRIYSQANRFSTTNIYNWNNEFIATLHGCYIVNPNYTHSNLLCVRRVNTYESNTNSYYCLIDLSRNNAEISGHYDDMVELNNGDYIGYGFNDGDRWYVSADGTERRLPRNIRHVFSYPGILALYDTDFIFMSKSVDGIPGHLYDIDRNQIGNISIEECMSRGLKSQGVYSSFLRNKLK